MIDIRSEYRMSSGIGGGESPMTIRGVPKFGQRTVGGDLYVVFRMPSASSLAEYRQWSIKHWGWDAEANRFGKSRERAQFIYPDGRHWRDAETGATVDANGEPVSESRTVARENARRASNAERREEEYAFGIGRSQRTEREQARFVREESKRGRRTHRTHRAVWWAGFGE